MAKQRKAAGKTTTRGRKAAAAPEDVQPDLPPPPAGRGRKKKADSTRTPSHWQVAETKDEPAPAPAPAPIPHLATCGSCAAAVKYQPSASGHGMTVLERYGVDVDTTFGLGESGQPICPNGHGEMRLADEQQSAADAITEVAEKVNGTATATQAQLFDMAQPFNFEGAWMDIETKNGVVAELARVYEDDAARAKRSRKALEEAQALLSRMIDTYHERRVKKAREAQTHSELAVAYSGDPASAADAAPAEPATTESSEPTQPEAEAAPDEALEGARADDQDTADNTPAAEPATT